MACLSRNDIETIAAQIISNYKSLYRFDDFPAERVDPYILAHDLLGLTIEYYHLSNDGSVLGLTSHSSMGVEVKDDDGELLIYYLDGKTLLIEKALHEDKTQLGRHNFTVMHETAHQVLGHLYALPNRKANCRVHYCTMAQRQRKTFKDWDEWQADTMASALLLPADFVRNALYQVGLGNGVAVLSRWGNPEEYEQFCEAAAFLGASKQALAIRMKQLGLLRYEPCRAVSVFMDREEDDMWQSK